MYFGKLCARVLCSLALCSVIGASRSYAQTSGAVKRNVKVCLVHNILFPVKNFDRVEKALQGASREFGARVGITFSVFRRVDYPYTLEDDYGVAQGLKEKCSGSDMRLIFTNDRISSNPGDTLYLQGHASPEFGHALFYNAGRYAARQDAAGNDVLPITIMHELGHLFGVEHIFDRDSFMHPNVTRSFGRWNEEVLEIIVRNRYRRWNVP